MNPIKALKEKYTLNQLLFFEGVYSIIEQEAIEDGDSRVTKEGGVSDQLQSIRDAIYELRIESGIPIPPAKVEMQTLKFKASRGVDIKE